MSNLSSLETQVEQDPVIQGSKIAPIFKKLTIITADSSIYVDGEFYDGFDLSWIPEYNGIEVHAVQWQEDHGEIELKSSDPNIQITELGIFEQAISQWQERKIQKFNEEQERLEEEKKSNELGFSVDDAEIEELLSQL